jgi:glyoxylase-like metal-dependent hydrolase (beta-lactamase superfamily II)
MKIETFFDPITYTLTYIVYDEQTRDAFIIDSVWEYEQASSTTSLRQIKKYQDFIESNNLKLHYILETHAHADHLTGSQKLKELYPNAKIAIGARIKEVQSTFKEVFNMKDFNTDGIQFDELLEDNQVLEIGSLKLKVLYTPGHTPACSSYLVNDKVVFTGDALFMEDFGTGRCDFPAGSAKDMYQSLRRLYELDDEVEVYTGHDYQPGGRELKYKTTIGSQKKNNIHMKAETSEDEYVKMRQERDKKLKAPKLLLPSIQINIDAGKLPEAEDNGTRYMKMPITES